MALQAGSRWDDATVAVLQRLVAEGHSASQIALRLGGGLTRNAVIGKVARLGLTFDVARKGEQPISPPRPLSPRAKVTTPPVKSRAAPPRPKAPPASAAPDQHAAPKPLSDLRRLRVVHAPSRWLRLAEIGPRMCHYIEGDPGPGRMDEALMCAADAGEEIYCTAHAALCFNVAASAKARAGAGSNVRGRAGAGQTWGKRGGALAE